VNSAWFLAIRDVIPTKEHLFKIHLADTNRCNQCDETDTLPHRITECNAEDIWDWTRERLAIILRTNNLQVPAEWPLKPQFHTWPPQRHAANLGILAHLVYYRTQHCHQPTLADFADFMRRARWKAYRLPHRLKRVGNYLTVDCIIAPRPELIAAKIDPLSLWSSTACGNLRPHVSSPHRAPQVSTYLSHPWTTPHQPTQESYQPTFCLDSF